jgi:fatty acid desaturase
MPDQRLEGVDYDAFGAEIFALRDEIRESLSYDDFRHLKKLIWINRLCTFFGYATAWLLPNPVSAYLISQGLVGRWMVMHHVGHGGYDNVPDIPRRYTSKVFAMGWRRFVDWFDWIYPQAWNYEHNVLHHYHTSEQHDPDLVEDHAEFARCNEAMPMWWKYTLAFAMSVTWKFSYYAPNTIRALEQRCRNAPSDSCWPVIWHNAFNPMNARVRRLWILCYLPYICVTFIIIPALFLPLQIMLPTLGGSAVLFVLINRVLAEFMTNFHTFAVIAPNHAGDDLYRFDRHFKGKGEFCVNQVISSCDFHTGTETVDYLQKYLNYQIEHHLFPRIPLCKYREYQPRVKAICEKHNVPYIQQSVVKRFWKLIDIIVGKGTMHRLESTAPDTPPTPDESAADAAPTAPVTVAEQTA